MCLLFFLHSFYNFLSFKMKFLVFLIIILQILNNSLEFVQLINCPADIVPVKNQQQICARITCLSPQKFDIIRCSDIKCPEGKQIGLKNEDNSKMYPDCCGGPICES
ncbi:uncharacterized protein LOC122505765 [Leptopilina heterotoma]|uniref:uncharacterized protein LOC122505765 n=1 Tax=Leptopilina heterotoma TaxID=63436 RepID=UPI001CA88CCC|nr:uncharacterized protein LOC122505765 [Leptopilina heterotoma]